MGKTNNKNSSVLVLDTYSKWFNLALIIICFLVLGAVRLQVNQNTTGDEPYYLLMDYSMVHDHDLTLANNYHHKDYLSFYKNPVLGLQGGTPVIRAKYAAKAYSVHGTGLPIFLLPGFAIAAKTGATFEMVLLATFVVCLTWVWTEQVTKNRMVAYVAATLLVLCYFFNSLTGAIYPDMLIAAIILIALIMLERYYTTTLHQIVIGLALGFLVLVHFKALSFIVPALLVLCYRFWNKKHNLPWISIALVGAFIAYYFLTLHQWFGLWNLSAIEGGQSFGASPTHNASAMLFDSNRGLLVYNPILLLIFVGLPIWFKRHPKSLAITILTLIPSILVLCLIPNWNGSAAPTGRYIMEFLPAFIPAIAFSLTELRKVWQRAAVFVLVALTFLISLDATMQRFPYIDGNLYQVRPLLFSQVQSHIGIAIDHILPAFSNQTTLLGPHDVLKLVAGYIVLLCLVIYGYFIANRHQARGKNN